MIDPENFNDQEEYLTELCAEEVHKQWREHMRYIFAYDTSCIPVFISDIIRRQMDVDYEDLSEEDKSNRREYGNRFVKITEA